MTQNGFYNLEEFAARNGLQTYKPDPELILNVYARLRQATPWALPQYTIDANRPYHYAFILNP